MKLECTRTDLGDAIDMMNFQRAFMVYRAVRGYVDFTYQLTVSDVGLVTCIIEPALNDVQKNDILHRMQTLKDVTNDPNDPGYYLFIPE